MDIFMQHDVQELSRVVSGRLQTDYCIVGLLHMRVFCKLCGSVATCMCEIIILQVFNNCV